MSVRFAKRSKVATIIGASLLLWGLAAAPAFAEGSWNSSLSNAGPGFSSRWWSDNNYDANSTRVLFGSCQGGTNANYLVNRVNLNLWRDNGVFPDHNHGVTTSTCNGTWASWGRMTSVGSYKWTVEDMYVNYYGAGDFAWISNGRVTVPSLTTQY